jgi:hypothetical protein
MKRNRLVHGEQLMKSIFPQPANRQPEIDLREGSYAYRHGRLIVTIRVEVFEFHPAL